MFLQQTVISSPRVDFERLGGDYLPPKLLFREPHVGWLIEKLVSFNDLHSEDCGILLLGGPGSGKSAVSQLAIRALTASLSVRGERNICVATINGSLPLTMHGFISQVLGYIDPFRNTAGISERRLIEFLGETLVNNDFRLVILVDAIKLNSQTRSVLEEFFESKRGVRFKPVCLIVNARKADQESHNGFIGEALKLEPYTKEEIWEILHYRLSLASATEIVEDEVLEHVAEKAALTGDLGYAIQVVKEALRLALTRGEARVKLEHIAEAAKTYLDPSLLSVTRSLGLHEKLILYSILQLAIENGDVSIGDVESYYMNLCSHINLHPRRHTQIWFYVKRLQELGFIETRVGDKQGRGRTTKIFPPQQLVQLQNELRGQIKKYGKAV